jgi:hypothetical protein
MIDFKCLIGDLIYTKGNIQEFINRRFKSLDKTQIQFRYWDYAVMKNGLKFYVTEDFPCIEQVIEDYRFDDITKETTVVDLGANIGGFTLQAALKAKRVIAYEPLRYKELERNIAFNGLTNIEVHRCGVGNGFNQEIRWGDCLKVPTVLFEDIVLSLKDEKRRWLKADVEGFERYMEPTDIATFDRVEMELHSWGDGPKVAQNIIDTLNLTHDVEVDQLGANGMVGILHAVRK